MSSNRLFIVGAGAWGSALAIALSEQFQQVFLYTHSKNQAKWLKQANQHNACGGILFPDNIVITHDLTDIAKSDSVLIVVPSEVFISVLEQIKPLIKQQPIAWATKGFDHQENIALSQKFEASLNLPACVISGPSFAIEVAQKKPTALVVASQDEKLRKHWLDIIQTLSLRSYENEDVIGVEVGGLVKNVLAIAAGIANGLGYGANTQAALITRGLNEMLGFGLALGANEKTFMGLSGLGDLVLTCSDNLSRNRRFGQLLSKNIKVEKALQEIDATVEGVLGVKTVMLIAEKLKIEMPICKQVALIIDGKITPKEAVDYLMSRPPNAE
jgi:glycerol-3-phosphate dehydrogenase (NAD(P)+)